MPPLSRLTITTTSDLREPQAQLRRWVEANGGRWVAKPVKGITHLVCSKEAWKKKNEIVTKAQEYGAQVVSYDWLEDSLHKKRKLAERKYLWDTVTKERRTRKKIARLGPVHDRMRFEKGAKIAELDIGSGESMAREDGGVQAGGFRSCVEALRERKRRREEKGVDGISCDLAISSEGAEEKTDRPKEKSNHNATHKPDEYPDKQTNGSCVSAIDNRDPSPPDPSCTSPQRMLPTPPPTTTNIAPPPPAPKAERLADNYHLYIDSTGFEYDVRLHRTNLRLNRISLYTLRLFESNTTPHTYCTFIRYKPPPPEAFSLIPLGTSGLPKSAKDRPALTQEPRTTPEETSHKPTSPAIEVTTPPDPSLPPPSHAPYRTLLVPLNSEYSTAFAAFTDAFRGLTFVAWELRHCVDVREMQKKAAKETAKEPFVYTLPIPPRAIGVVPALPVVAKDAGKDKEVHGLAAKMGLPGMDVGIGEGMVGSDVIREAAREREREREERDAEKRRRKNGAKGLVQVRGRVGASAGRGSLGMSGAVGQRVRGAVGGPVRKIKGMSTFRQVYGQQL
ncbi:hypothetical protein M011DRAFT_478297 [Sporormia fimetaria CBS 119925]|uniref:BRCT domain-containing protein n=1 Tax=Sporormia fimetaria CBS 119925 TaxID=1340428 RepID=A0A6A6V6T0_9PLEO|nr:hypothetical protein M011DRAFT_478297 [Sporormia fimetaria CBS 119925]